MNVERLVTFQTAPMISIMQIIVPVLLVLRRIVRDAMSELDVVAMPGMPIASSDGIQVKNLMSGKKNARLYLMVGSLSGPPVEIELSESECTVVCKNLNVIPQSQWNK